MMHNIGAAQQALKVIPVRTKAFTFHLSAVNRDGNGRYRVTIPEPMRNCVSMEIAGFETQAIEQNISTQENVVAWTEGLRITTGEAPTLYENIPVFDHELCIRETVDSVNYYYKVGLCPQFNEVSTELWDSDGDARITSSSSQDLRDATNVDDWYFSTTRNREGSMWAAPHYGYAFQQCRAAGFLSEMQFYTAAMCQRRHVDLSTADVIRFGSPVANPPPQWGETQFRVVRDAVLAAYFTDTNPAEISTEALCHGFLCCSPWYPSDICDFLNFQLSSVTNSAYDAGGAGADYNRCGTTSVRPSNTYRLEYVEGRFRLRVISGDATFAVLQNVNGCGGTSAYRDMHHGDGQRYDGVAQTPVATRKTGAVTGNSARRTGLWTLLGFTSSASGAQTTESVGGGTVMTKGFSTYMGIRASQPFHPTFETVVPPAYYTASTFASSLSTSLNAGRPRTSAYSSDTSNVPASVCTFTDSLGNKSSLILTTGHRNPYQYAASLQFMLNRLDARGIYFSGHSYAYDDAFGQLANGRVSGNLTETQMRLFYDVSYDHVTRKFTVSNREISAFNFSESVASSLYPSVAGAAVAEYPTLTIRAPFSLSFRTADIAVTAAVLGVSSVPGPSTFASIFGFESERVYKGASLTSSTVASCGVSYPNTLTQGQPNDYSATESLCLPPLGEAVASNLFRHNDVHFRGTGPDADAYPRYDVSITGSVQNDKKLTIHAAHPLMPFSTGNGAVKSGGPNLSPDADVYNNNTVQANLTAANNVVTGVAFTNLGTNIRSGSLVVWGSANTNDTHYVDDSSSPSDAMVYVATVGSGGAISSPTLLFGGSGTGTNPYTTTGYYGYQLNACENLRVTFGAPHDETYADTDNDATRVVVQAAAVKEYVNPSGGHGNWRTMQQNLPFSPGDLVKMGLQQSVLLGGTNLGAADGNSIEITQVSSGGYLIAGTGTKLAGTAVVVDHHYIVMQGDCRTVIRIVAVPTTTTYTFVIVERGVGHYVADPVYVFGPIVPYMIGLVEEVGQGPVRRQTSYRADVESEFVSQFATPYAIGGVYQSCVTSLARDGSRIKVRLAFNCRYDYTDFETRGSHPSNLLSISPIEEPRIQLLNGGPSVTAEYARRDTVWPSAGLLRDSEAAGTVKLPNEWNLDTVSGLLITLENVPGTEENNVYYGMERMVSNVIAKITFGARVSRTWATVHSKRFNYAQIEQLEFRLLDLKGNDYDFGGRACRLTINFHYK